MAVELKGIALQNATFEYISLFTGNTVELKGLSLQYPVFNAISSFTGNTVELKGLSFESLGTRFYFLNEGEAIKLYPNQFTEHSDFKVCINQYDNETILAVTTAAGNPQTSQTSMTYNDIIAMKNTIGNNSIFNISLFENSHLNYITINNEIQIGFFFIEMPPD